MRLTYFGHSAFLLETAGQRLVFDPFLSKNPHGAVDPASVPCDYVLCTHAHDDHIMNAMDLSHLHGATIVAPYELAIYFVGLGAKTIDLMPGGGINLPWGRIQMTPAIHGSALEFPDGRVIATSIASGFLVQSEGRSLYHAGDTALFGDMKLIGRNGLDIALIPIGDRYTMGPVDALEALNFLRPKVSVPMHYNTFPVIQTDPHAFAAHAKAAGHAVNVMKAGESREI